MQAEQPHGLVLVAGLAGAGKTATLAAMVDHVNAGRDCHVVTIEDPIEVLVVNARVAERVAAGRTGELADEMAAGDLYGMQTFDQSLVQLYRDGLVTRADALDHAEAPGELRFELDRADFTRGQGAGTETARAGLAAAAGQPT